MSEVFHFCVARWALAGIFDGIISGHTFPNRQLVVEKLDQEFVGSIFEISNGVFVAGPIYFVKGVVVPLGFGLDVFFEIVGTSNVSD
jgi:hypothetical protein